MFLFYKVLYISILQWGGERIFLKLLKINLYLIS